MAHNETNHWFWLGRRYIIASTLKQLNLSKNCKILEVGSGTGGNVEILTNFGNLDAVEMDEEARNISKKRHPEQKVLDGYLPYNLPKNLKRYDVICLFDVLEHVKESRLAVNELIKLLKPGGYLILTVPAHQFLWSDWDDYHHHYRRYNFAKLHEDIVGTPLRPKKISHFNFTLMPVIIFARLMIKFLRLEAGAGHGIPNKNINALLFFILKIEAKILRYINIPFGVSMLCVLKNNAKINAFKIQ